MCTLTTWSPKVLVTHLCLHIFLWSCSEVIYGILNANDKPVEPSHLDGARLAALNEATCSVSLYSGCTEKGVTWPMWTSNNSTGVARHWNGGAFSQARVLQCLLTRPARHLLQPAGPPLLVGCGSCHTSCAQVSVICWHHAEEVCAPCWLT